MAMEQAAGEGARLEFRVLDNRMPAPMIHWQESPWYIETALILTPPLEDCREVRIFANRSPAPPETLSTQASRVLPLRLATQAEELAAWERIPDRRCALLLTAGRIAEDGFTGVSVSIPGQIIRRHAIGLQEDLSGEKHWWGLAPFGVVYDAALVPFVFAFAILGSESPEPTEPVTVIFQFPDGSRKTTRLREKELRQLLEDTYPAVLSSLPFARKRVRSWVRAALVKLRLEFTEEAGGELATDEWLPKTLRLQMVDGHTGNWTYRLDTASARQNDLTLGMGDASSIRFELASENGP